MNLLEKVKQLEQTHKAHKPLQPRHHAEAIMQLKTREERAQALELVPMEIRHVVRFFVASEYAKRNRKPLPDLEKNHEQT